MKNINNYLAKVLNIPLQNINACGLPYEAKRIPKNQFLLQYGEICRYLFSVEKGLLKMYSIDKNGKEHIIQFAPESWLIFDRTSLYFHEKSILYRDRRRFRSDISAL